MQIPNINFSAQATNTTQPESSTIRTTAPAQANLSPIPVPIDFKKYLLPVAVAGVGLFLLSNKNKRKKLSGMKFNIKAIGQNILGEVQNVALVSGGMIASQKFLDFDKLLANRDPNNTMLNMLVTHQGAVKLVIGLGVSAMSKNDLIKNIGYGIAIGGLIKEIRVLTTMNGTTWVPQIGANMLKQNAGRNVLGANQLQERAANSVLGMRGLPMERPLIDKMRSRAMFPGSVSSVGCGDYSY